MAQKLYLFLQELAFVEPSMIGVPLKLVEDQF